MLIAGAKGFAKELLEAILQTDPAAQPVFYDDQSEDLPELFLDRFQIIRSRTDAENYFKTVDTKFALGIGDPNSRKKLFEVFTSIGGQPASIISPFARIGSVNNAFGEGVNILSNAVVETDNLIGVGVLIHVGALISHDVKVGNFCEISPGVSLLGNVKVGDMCRLGTGCIILPNIRIGDGAIVGAGAVVTADVAPGQTVVGVPAKLIRK
jgi:sugar O-acyltransferase (sialic acid O-acetyltransferase NeuD family)